MARTIREAKTRKQHPAVIRRQERAMRQSQKAELRKQYA